MSALLCLRLAAPKTNQFIRPMSPFDIVSSTQRQVLSREHFAVVPEYAKAISRGQAGKCVDALMDALGDATMMSMEDTWAIAEQYMSNVCTHKVPSSMAEASGDEATGLPATSVAQACSKKGYPLLLGGQNV